MADGTQLALVPDPDELPTRECMISGLLPKTGVRLRFDKETGQLTLGAVDSVGVVDVVLEPHRVQQLAESLLDALEMGEPPVGSIVSILIHERPPGGNDPVEVEYLLWRSQYSGWRDQWNTGTEYMWAAILRWATRQRSTVQVVRHGPRQ